MSRFFPNTLYAEDQPLARTILVTHVLHRGLQVGATVGIATGAATYWYRFSRSEVRQRTVLRSEHVTSTPRGVVYPTFSQTVLRQAGVGSAIGAIFLSVALAAKMHGKEDIEWRDRSWRLMQNHGQLEVDDWSVAGALTGTATASMRRDGLKRIAGMTVVGSLVGVVGYLGWRYGVRKGQSHDEHEGIGTHAPAAM